METSSITRRQALEGLSGFTLASGLISQAWADSVPSLNFLAVGDWGRGGDFHQREVAQRMSESAKLLSGRFVISVGDNFYEDGVTSVDDPAWRMSFESVYDAPSLQVPWYVALGNHDYRGNAQAQLDYSSHSSRWRLPTRWYSFEEPTPDNARIAFYVLDTSPMISEYYEDGAKKVKVGDQKQNVDVQLKWLDKALATSKADWNIVIGHHPVYSGARENSTPSKDPGVPPGMPELVTRLDPILQRHRVQLYLNGHDHDLAHISYGATHYVCTGAGSKMRKDCYNIAASDFCSLQSGFVMCSVNRDRLHLAYRDYTGAELHVVNIQRAA